MPRHTLSLGRNVVCVGPPLAVALFTVVYIYRTLHSNFSGNFVCKLFNFVVVVSIHHCFIVCDERFGHYFAERQ